MKSQIHKRLALVAMLISLVFAVTNVTAKKPAKPDKTDGVAAALNCELLSESGDTVLSDGLGQYVGGVDKVACGTGGTVQPNLSGISLSTVSKGAIKRAIRKIDLAFGECSGPDGNACRHVPDAFLLKAASDEEVEEMEDVWIGTGPYPDDPEMGHIQLMAPGTYEMKFHMSPLGLADRFVIQLMNRDEFPSELGQGGWCSLEHNPNFEWVDAATEEDMTVCIWPDGNDADSLPDGYTITTGDITEADCAGTLTMETPPAVTPRSREATICSTVAGDDFACDGDMCNLLGTVPLQLTLHAAYQ